MREKKMKLTPKAEEWLKYLAKPSTRKLKNQLVIKGTAERCCLGHGAIVCGVRKRALLGKSVLDKFPAVVSALGLHSCAGRLVRIKGLLPSFRGRAISTLVRLNDHTEATAQEIGRWIRENAAHIFRG